MMTADVLVLWLIGLILVDFLVWKGVTAKTKKQVEKNKKRWEKNKNRDGMNNVKIGGSGPVVKVLMFDCKEGWWKALLKAGQFAQLLRLSIKKNYLFIVFLVDAHWKWGWKRLEVWDEMNSVEISRKAEENKK